MTYSKYQNKRTVMDNITFASRKEASRYQELKLLLKAGEIAHLELQPRYKLDINGVHICDYIGDFQYEDGRGNGLIVEDTKSEGTKTPVYRLKKKLMWAIYGIEIQEV